MASSENLTRPRLLADRLEAARALRISARKLDYLITKGEIASTRIGSRVLIAWTELERFIESKTVRPEATTVFHHPQDQVTLSTVPALTTEPKAHADAHSHLLPWQAAAVESRPEVRVTRKEGV